ncbi:error-prone DNA polymerase [Dongia sedimenti]|uniref:Error-prone DNA polymerase n=1 Tax=Dongia sedimenti TaxID=3064282 RepID=A0ABU0YP00_9PROT|nr:error-prone DNA polymerase [Rhodospirillaceae bacterium R-7]
MAYVELSACTNFSFLEGASHAEELVEAAERVGHKAIAIADRNSLAGIARAHEACKTLNFRLVVGCRLTFRDGREVLAFPTDRFAYGRLCELLTAGRRRAPKGECHLDYADLVQWGEGMILVALTPETEDATFPTFLTHLKRDFPKRAHLALCHRYHGDDRRRLERDQALADRIGLPTVAINDVRYHAPERRMLADILTCIRHTCTIDEAGYRLRKNAERHLKPEAEMRRLFRGFEAAVDRSGAIAERCRFSMDELKYEYPTEVVGPDETAQQTLTRLAWEGADWRYPAGVPEAVKKQIGEELALIEQLDFAPYFLTVHDIVRFAKSENILCQGRGSAANSAICYCLGITSIDPAEGNSLFARFISAERGEKPDIDVDFEHEERERVIQYVYRKYGRDRAGLAATVIRYRSRSAIRDVGKALGLSTDVTDTLAKTIWGWSQEIVPEERVRQLGLDPADARLAMALHYARALIGFPRHLSQHVGGMVISRGPLSSLVPIENAAMADRTVIQWDKDDLESLGLMKVDILALGMLTCIHKAFDLIVKQGGPQYTLATVPQDDTATYDMLCRADTIGVFQVESRAQMSMLPRLKPRKLYDLTIEVAIVRPGPIQGDMVHPYLRRREGREPIDYQGHPELERILGKTLGVPLFQEQAMRIAIECAGFTPDQADGLRRSMATFRHNGDVDKYRVPFMEGMRRHGYNMEFAERCFRQIEGFGNYGFPESHAASFALLAYISAWIKCRHPAVFATALLNSQPMGFYQPAQIVRDAVLHGVAVRPVDINLSEWDCTLEDTPDGIFDPSPRPLPQGEREVLFRAPRVSNSDPLAVQRKESPSPLAGEGWGEGSTGLSALPPKHPAIRLGFRQAKGLGEKEIARLLAARGEGYRSAEQLWRRAELEARTLGQLANADAFRSIGLDRRQALWTVRGLGEKPLPLFAAQEAVMAIHAEEGAGLPEMPLSQHVIEDYRALQLSLKRHPMAFLRAHLARRGMIASDGLAACKNGQKIAVAGLVLVRQRPGTASGVIFMTLEDERGIVNVVVWSHLFERARGVVMSAKLIGCEGKLQVEGQAPHQVIHVVAERLTDLSGLLQSLREDSAAPIENPQAPDQPFRLPLAYADAVVHHNTRPDPRDPAPPAHWDPPAVLDIRSRDFH